MDINQRLSERMASVTPNLGSEDPIWCQFVRDHKRYLKERATLTTYTTELLTPFRYRPEEFYVKHNGIIQATWVWMFINDIRSQTDFTEARTQYLMLDWRVVKDLYALYRGSETYVASEEG